MNQLINDVGAGVQPHHLAKSFLWSEIGWIWAKIGKIKGISSKCN